MLPPGANGSATIAMGWFFPNRDFMGTNVGNHYVELVRDSEAAALEMLGLVPKIIGAAKGAEGAEGAEEELHVAGSSAAADDVMAWGAFSSALIASPSMPTWLGDSLLNSLHHFRSAMWLGDSRWRQWESFSCVNVDSVHNDGERHIPYLFLLGSNGTVSKMRAWAKGALADGMIQEQLACGCMDAVPKQLDQPCGRVMGDVSSIASFQLTILPAVSRHLEVTWNDFIAIVRFSSPAVEISVGQPLHESGLFNTANLCRILILLKILRQVFGAHA